MWIEKSQNKYRACDRYTDPLTGRQHKVGVTIQKDTPQQRNIARKKLDDLIARKQSLAPASMHLSDLTKLYLADLKNTAKASTVRRNGYACDRFLKMFGDCDVSKLTAGIVKQRIIEYRDKKAAAIKDDERREKAEKSVTMINEHITRFKAFIRWAYHNDYLYDISWIDKLTKLKDKTEKEKVADKFLERSECTLLLDAMEHETWRNVTELMLKSGLRCGEALALNESDLDFINREIHVNKTLDNVDKKTTTTKTLTSTRSVYMQDDLYAFLRSVVRSNKEKRKMLYLNRSPLFFSPTGGYACYAAYLHYLHSVSERVLGYRISTHVLRHTHASILAEESIDNPKITVDLISRRLGHADSRITRDIYIHVTEKRKEKENNALRKVRVI